MVFICACTHLQAQVNYVLNPSFEQYSKCPTFLDQIRYANYWNAIDTTDSDPICTPEYCNACDKINDIVSIPMGAYYYHYAHTGDGMAEVVMYSDVMPVPNYYRDYLQGKLFKTLTSGTRYCVTFFVTFEYQCQYACNNIGAYLDDGSIDEGQDSSECSLPQTTKIPQLLETSVITDSLNWIKIQGSFVSNGTEKYVTIGNFFDDAHTILVQTPGNGGGGAFYLIDDVSVIESNAVADAGPNVHIALGDSAHIGTSDEGMPETWYVLGGTTPIGYSGGIWVKPDSTTSYVVEMDLCGNVTRDTVTVSICSPITPVATHDTGMCMGSTVLLNSELTGGTWSNGDPAIATIDTSKNAVIGVSKGSTVLTYHQPYGCTEITNVTVDDCRDVVVHDVITPNGDGLNDLWVIEGLQYYPNNTVQLYDKWGDKVYDRVGYNNDWSGGSLPDGTYYYLVRLNAPNLHGSKNVWTGSLLIKR